MKQSFEQFMRQREEAARAYVRGNAQPLDRIVARSSDATFFGPQGGKVHGASRVSSTYANDAQNLESDGRSRFEILQMVADDDLGYWVGIQHATLRMRGQPEAVPMDLRVTEVFRREEGEWKMVHRHADPLAHAPQAAQAMNAGGHQA